MIKSLPLANNSETSCRIICIAPLRAFASSREPTFLFITRRREGAKKKNFPSVSAAHCHLPQQAVGGLAVGGFSVVSAEPKILPELVSGRWQPEGLTEGNVV